MCPGSRLGDFLLVFLQLLISTTMFYSMFGINNIFSLRIVGIQSEIVIKVLFFLHFKVFFGAKTKQPSKMTAAVEKKICQI